MTDEEQILVSSLLKDVNHVISQLQTQVNTMHQMVEQFREKIMKHFPVCTSCGRHYPFDQLRVATRTDVDEYESENEGYAGPSIGELYCGC